MIDKKGEKYFSLYACFPCFIHKGGEEFLFMHIVLFCIAYMQGELNISSTYRFMLSVSYIEELDNSSLCGTRV